MLFKKPYMQCLFCVRFDLAGVPACSYPSSSQSHKRFSTSVTSWLTAPTWTAAIRCMARQPSRTAGHQHVAWWLSALDWQV